jgi:hypothetical protein
MASKHALDNQEFALTPLAAIKRIRKAIAIMAAKLTLGDASLQSLDSPSTHPRLH